MRIKVSKVAPSEAREKLEGLVLYFGWKDLEILLMIRIEMHTYDYIYE